MLEEARLRDLRPSLRPSVPGWRGLPGAVPVSRRVVRPFTGKQVELLQTFASQAVIAVENVRLFTGCKRRIGR